MSPEEKADLTYVLYWTGGVAVMVVATFLVSYYLHL
jgi:hypothetical protein